MNRPFLERDLVNLGSRAVIHAFPLALAGTDERLRIASITGDRAFVRRLGDLGLGRGAEIRVRQRRPGGAMVVGRDGLRIALGRAATRRIMVNLVDASDVAEPPVGNPAATPHRGRDGM